MLHGFLGVAMGAEACQSGFLVVNFVERPDAKTIHSTLSDQYYRYTPTVQPLVFPGGLFRFLDIVFLVGDIISFEMFPRLFAISAPAG